MEHEVTIRDRTSEKRFLVPSLISATVSGEGWVAHVELAPGPTRHDYPVFQRIQLELGDGLSALQIQRIPWAQIIADAVASVGKRPS